MQCLFHFPGHHLQHSASHFNSSQHNNPLSSGTAIISCSSLHTCTKTCWFLSCKKVINKYLFCQITVSVTYTIYVSFILRYTLEFWFGFLREYEATTKISLPIIFKQNSLSELSGEASTYLKFALRQQVSRTRS